MRSFLAAGLAIIFTVIAMSLWKGQPSGLLLAAAALTFLLSIGHSVLGEKYLIGPLVKLDKLPVILGGVGQTRGVLRFAWHLTSLLWLGLAAVLAFMHWDSGSASKAFLWMIVLVFGFSGLYALWSTRGAHRSWVYFLAIAALAGIAVTTPAAATRAAAKLPPDATASRC